MLKEHNREAYEATKNMLLEHRECCLVAATGIGKSNITTELIQEFGLNALIIAPKTSIRDEWSIMPDKYGIPPTFSTMTYQYFVRHYEDLYGFDAYIFDEAHHTGAAKWGKVIRKFREGLDTEFVLGLTADPNRYNDKSKRDKENKIISSVVKTVFNDHGVYGHDQRSAIENGILPRATYVCSIYNADEMFDKYAAMDLTEELRGRLNYTRTNCEAIEDTLRRNVPNNAPVKGIVFVDTINNIDIGVRLARRAFPREAVHYIHSKLKAKENAETLEMFKKAKSGFIVSVDMIGEGLHVNGVNTVIMLRKTGSPSVYTQQIGRGLAAGGADVTIFDFVRNDTSIKKVLARIKNMSKSYQNDEEDDSEEDTADNGGGRTRYPKISDQFIVKDKASDILEVFDEIDRYICLKNQKRYYWTPEEDQILRDNYPTMGCDVYKLFDGRNRESCRNRVRCLGIVTNHHWTSEEDQILRDNYPTMGYDVCKLLPKKTKNACRGRAEILGLKYLDPNVWTLEEEKILKENYPIIGSNVTKLLTNKSVEQCYRKASMMGVKYTKWTPEEDRILRDNYPTMGCDVIKLLSNKTQGSIHARARKLKLYTSMRNVWTIEEDQILRDNYPTMGYDVCKLLNHRSRSAVCERVRRLKLYRDRKTCNDIWTPEEDQILRDNYPTMGYDVCKLLGNRSRSAICTRIRHLKLYKDRKTCNDIWTPEEDQILKDNYPTMGRDVYKLLPNRGRIACGNRAHMLNISFNDIDAWTIEEDEIIKTNYPTIGTDVYIMLNNRSRQAVYRRANKLGVRYYNRGGTKHDQ